MRFSTIVVIFTLMLTLVAGSVFAEHVIDDSKNTGYLFVISGTSGSLDGGTLTLNGVPNVIYFSDRPARKAGHMSVSEFVEMWHKGDDSFKADPPNATLSVLKKDEALNLTIELMTVERTAPGTLVFKVTMLRTGQISEDGPPRGFVGDATLFIDNIYKNGRLL
ncbi:MAG: hypothetical protein N2A97_04715 [Thermodesulfobacteriales bacterium]